MFETFLSELPINLIVFFFVIVIDISILYFFSNPSELRKRGTKIYKEQDLLKLVFMSESGAIASY